MMSSKMLLSTGKILKMLLNATLASIPMFEFGRKLVAHTSDQMGERMRGAKVQKPID
jgi:hypothetical protein